MKFLFTSTLLCFVAIAFAQDTIKDTAKLFNSGERFYDTRIERHDNIDYEAYRNKFYQDNDTTKIKQVPDKPKQKSATIK